MVGFIRNRFDVGWVKVSWWYRSSLGCLNNYDIQFPFVSWWTFFGCGMLVVQAFCRAQRSFTFCLMWEFVHNVRVIKKCVACVARLSCEEHLARKPQCNFEFKESVSHLYFSFHWCCRWSIIRYPIWGRGTGNVGVGNPNKIIVKLDFLFKTWTGSEVCSFLVKFI